MDLISHLWQQYVNIALLPLAAGSVVVRREMVVFNNQTVSKVEGAANGLMQCLIDGQYLMVVCFRRMHSCPSSDCLLGGYATCQAEENRLQASQ